MLSFEGSSIRHGVEQRPEGGVATTIVVGIEDHRVYLDRHHLKILLNMGRTLLSFTFSDRRPAVGVMSSGSDSGMGSFGLARCNPGHPTHSPLPLITTGATAVTKPPALEFTQFIIVQRVGRVLPSLPDELPLCVPLQHEGQAVGHHYHAPGGGNDIYGHSEQFRKWSKTNSIIKKTSSEK